MSLSLTFPHKQLLSQTKPSVLLDRIEFRLNENENNLNDSKLLKQQYNFLRPDHKPNTEHNGVPSSPIKHQANGIRNGRTEVAGIAKPKFILCSPDAIQLEWSKHVSVLNGNLIRFLIFFSGYNPILINDFCFLSCSRPTHSPKASAPAA